MSDSKALAPVLSETLTKPEYSSYQWILIEVDYLHNELQFYYLSSTAVVYLPASVLSEKHPTISIVHINGFYSYFQFLRSFRWQ